MWVGQVRAGSKIELADVAIDWMVTSLSGDHLVSVAEGAMKNKLLSTSLIQRSSLQFQGIRTWGLGKCLRMSYVLEYDNLMKFTSIFAN